MRYVARIPRTNFGLFHGARSSLSSLPLGGSVPFLRDYGFKVIFGLRERNLASFNGGGPGLCLLATRYFTAVLHRTFKGECGSQRSLATKVGRVSFSVFGTDFFSGKFKFVQRLFSLAVWNAHYFQMTGNYDCC